MYTLSHIFICIITDLAAYVPVLLKMNVPHQPAYFLIFNLKVRFIYKYIYFIFSHLILNILYFLSNKKINRKFTYKSLVQLLVILNFTSADQLS